MEIIKTKHGQFIKLDEFANDGRFIWGYRWNRNEQVWGKHCIRFVLSEYEIITEDDLPKKLPDIEVDNT